MVSGDGDLLRGADKRYDHGGANGGRDHGRAEDQNGGANRGDHHRESLEEEVTAEPSRWKDLLEPEGRRSTPLSKELLTMVESVDQKTALEPEEIETQAESEVPRTKVDMKSQRTKAELHRRNGLED